MALTIPHDQKLAKYLSHLPVDVSGPGSVRPEQAPGDATVIRENQKIRWQSLYPFAIRIRPDRSRMPSIPAENTITEFIRPNNPLQIHRAKIVSIRITIKNQFYDKRRTESAHQSNRQAADPFQARAQHAMSSSSTEDPKECSRIQSLVRCQGNAYNHRSQKAGESLQYLIGRRAD